MRKSNNIQKWVCVVLSFIALVVIVSPIFGAQPWQRAVPKEMIFAASQFSNLQSISFATQLRVNCTHTNFYEVHGIDTEGRQILVNVDPETNEVVGLVRLCPRHDQFSTVVDINSTEAMNAHNQFLSDHSLELPSGFSLDEVNDVTLEKCGIEYYWLISYKHIIDDEVLVRPDFIIFEVDANYADIRSYSKVSHDVTVSTTPTIGDSNAISIAREFLDTNTSFDPCLPVLSTQLEIVYPNRYFDSWTWQWTDEQALIWNVRFGQTDPVVEVWVDAHTEEIQGGEAYEGPIAEKFATNPKGLSSQLDDLKIWDDEHRDPLPTMQYDDIEHRLGEDPPNNTKQDIINAIADPNNYVWMLHTHGGSGPYARIDVPDDIKLFPGDIPDNTLRWALLSCCHSGDDASGDNDFRAKFVQKGTRLFTGYVGSVNPDDYERWLAYYLEMGREFENANESAKQKINAELRKKIVYEYAGDFCYNQCRLAPLHVDVSGPARSVYPGEIFKMSVKVRNRENDLHEDANNVTVKLEVPTGFSIPLQSDSQNLGTIVWHQTATATWDVLVHAAPGTYTFDAIVWSDNLGVDVDDPDNPYHQYEVTVLTDEGVAVDDFDSYPNDVTLQDVWNDNSTGAEISVETDPNFIHDGNSVKYQYDNTSTPYYSEMDALVSDLEVDPNWTAGGVKAMTLYFYGHPSNTITANDQMYVALEDVSTKVAVVLYNGDMNDIKIPIWQQWNIRLQDFNDINNVDLTHVNKVYIGFGNKDYPQPGDSGTIYIDNIMLYPPRCLQKPDIDLNGDCVVDFKDFAVLTNSWLETGMFP